MLAGLGPEARASLGRLVRDGPPLLTPETAARLLSLNRDQASHQLARWARAGWLARIKRGVYMTIPLEAITSDVPLEDPWIVATSLFSPCYIAGWSAGEHWGLTEQMFRSLCVVTAARPRNRHPTLRGARFSLYSNNAKKLFGLKTVWRGRSRTSVSDPARTIVDVLADPALGAGIRHSADMLSVFLREHSEDTARLISYAERLGNGAVFKRLGFLLTTRHPELPALAAACRQRLTTGYVKLDPKLQADRLVTVWRLWVPQSWRATTRD